MQIGGGAVGRFDGVIPRANVPGCLSVEEDGIRFRLDVAGRAYGGRELVFPWDELTCVNEGRPSWLQSLAVMTRWVLVLQRGEEAPVRFAMPRWKVRSARSAIERARALRSDGESS